MTLRKITIDNSVRHIPKSEQTRENKPIKTKSKKQSEQIQPISGGKSNTRKQNKNISQNNKKILKEVTASGFKYITE